jgi:hypothetical protein
VHIAYAVVLELEDFFSKGRAACVANGRQITMLFLLVLCRFFEGFVGVAPVEHGPRVELNELLFTALLLRCKRACLNLTSRRRSIAH